jgi:hypothetical protein
MRFHSLLTRSILAAALTVPCVVLASDGSADHGRDGKPRDVTLIAVYQGQLTGFGLDPSRCPDASHPVLLTLEGDADTTLGHGTYTQSHCEDEAHTSFRRGEFTLVLDTGDELNAVYSGQILGTPTTASDGKVIIDGAYRNTGGTGRLKRAHGRGLTAGVVDTTSGAVQITTVGTL